MSTGAESPAENICMPCRGTGRLISGLGGEPHEVQCPWCQGTGHRQPGIDAQQSPAEGSPPPEGAPAEPAPAEASPPPEPES